jgi:single-strand DNA-binding protein
MAAITNMNVTILGGNLAADAEWRQVGDGGVLNFRLINNTMKRKDDPGDTHVNGFDVAVWNKYGEALLPHLGKGSSVVVQGRIEERRYEDKDGKTQYRYGITTDKLELGQSRPRSNGNGSTQSEAAPAEPEQDPFAEGEESPFEESATTA